MHDRLKEAIMNALDLEQARDECLKEEAERHKKAEREIREDYNLGVMIRAALEEEKETPARAMAEAYREHFAAELGKEPGEYRNKKETARKLKEYVKRLREETDQMKAERKAQ